MEIAPGVSLFEIGLSLRDARLRRKLGVEEIAERTKIPGRYLAALEDERFHVLPHGLYRRSYLREYADFLGLDGDLYVEEYLAQHEPSEPEPAVVPPRPRTRIRPARLVNLVLVLGVTSALALAVWGLGGSEPKHASVSAPPPPVTAPRHPAKQRPQRPIAVTPARPRVLVVTATRGRCWLSVHVGSRDGPVAYEKTVEQGQTLRFGLGRPLWMRLGAPQNLDVAIGGKPVAGLPAHVANVRVTAGGLAAV
jgi:hypothetical protein